MKYDLIIVGMGPAGITAAIYAKRSGLNVLCLEKSMPGGLLNYMNNIDNFPGETNISGSDLAFKMFEQLKSLEVDYKTKTVERIIVEGDLKKVIISDDEYYYTKTVIIATGRSPKKLGLENEEELFGRGISTCAICDGALYKDKKVAVVGGGNSAVSEAIYLSNICEKVYLIHRRESLRASDKLSNCLNKKNNIEVIYNSNITSIKKEADKIKSITINENQEIEIACLFTYIGFVPKTSFVDTLNILDEDGYILVDGNYETSIKGIYAVGDIIKKEIYQIITSCGEGAVAAINASKYIEGE